MTLDADIIENMSANDVSYNSSLQYDENTVGDKLLKLDNKIKEINREGFIVKYQVDGRTSKIFDGSNLEELILEDNMEVKFINTSGYLLPATGSSSMLILVIIGTFSLGIPIIYTAFNVLKKRLIIKH